MSTTPQWLSHSARSHKYCIDAEADGRARAHDANELRLLFALAARLFCACLRQSLSLISFRVRVIEMLRIGKFAKPAAQLCVCG